MIKKKIFIRLFSSKATIFTEQQANIFNCIAQQRQNALSYGPNDELQIGMLHSEFTTQNNLITSDALNRFRQQNFPSYNQSDSASSPISVSAASILNDSSSTLANDVNISEHSLLYELSSTVNGNLYGSFSNALVIPVPAAPLIQGSPQENQLSSIVTQYFTRGDLFYSDYLRSYPRLQILLDSLSANNLNVTFDTLQHYQTTLHTGNLPGFFNTISSLFFSGRFRNLAVVLDFFSTRSLDFIMSNFPHTLQTSTPETVFLFSVFTVSFMGLWIMALDPILLFTVPLSVFHRNLLYLVKELSFWRLIQTQIRSNTEYFDTQVRNITQRFIMAREQGSLLTLSFRTDFERACRSSSAHGWYRFIRKWLKYLCGLPVGGGLIWLLLNPDAQKSLKNLYDWFIKTSPTNNPSNNPPSNTPPSSNPPSGKISDDLKDIAHKIIDVLHKFVTSFVNK